MIAYGLFAQRRIVRAILMTKPHHTFYEVLDSKGRRCIRLDKRSGRILARLRDDMPWQNRGCYKWVREENSIFAGYGAMCFDAIDAALYAYGLTVFDPFNTHQKTMQYTAVFIPLEEN